MQNEDSAVEGTTSSATVPPSCPEQQYPYAIRFIDAFVAFFTNRETDFIKRFQTISKIEMMLDRDPELVATLVFGGEDNAQPVFQTHGKEAVVEMISIFLRTEIAKEKLSYHELGLLKTKKKGDLRRASLIRDEQEQFFTMLKLRIGRESGGIKDFMTREVQKMDWKFHERLARALKKPALEFDNLGHSKFRSFLLCAWATEHKARNGKMFPALCFCSDPVIAKLAEFLGVQNAVTPMAVKKTWERLGLQKSSKITYWDVDKVYVRKPDRRVPRILLSELRRRG